MRAPSVNADGDSFSELLIRYDACGLRIWILIVWVSYNGRWNAMRL
jgi:hypothetical protein